jgi:hypothetical protein
MVSYFSWQPGTYHGADRDAMGLTFQRRAAGRECDITKTIVYHGFEQSGAGFSSGKGAI